MKPEAARKLEHRWLEIVERGRPAYLLTHVPLFLVTLLIAGAGCVLALEGSFTLLLSHPFVMLGVLAWLALVSVVIPAWQYRLIQSAVATRKARMHSA